VGTCSFCENKAQYRDRHTGQYLCLDHARLEVIAVRQQPTAPPLTIRPASASDAPRIGSLSQYFWDETEVDCFDRQYDVLTCPAFVVCDQDEVVGLAAYAPEAGWEALVLVMLGVLPAQQGRGGAQALLDAVREKAMELGMRRLMVVTSNDDLPALALYQRYGFRIMGINPGRIFEHHGANMGGFAGIPVRDEIRLEYRLAG
jgi:ribosomal protein S18 acetylase RimI-like enzyme